MYEIVIADTSCIIVLEKINRLDLLSSIFENVTITPEVAQEFGNPLPDWMKIETAQDPKRQQILEIELDMGEASAIALSLEKRDSLLLIDEKKGRRIAQELGLNIMGTLGVLIRAKEKQLIAFLHEEIEALETVAFRMADTLKNEVIKKYDI